MALKLVGLAAVAALCASTGQAVLAPSARAANGTILRSFTAAADSCSVGTGLAFDGTSLLVSCNYNNVIAAVSPVDGHRVGTYTIPGMSAIGAMAYDRGRNKVWACDGFLSGTKNVWLIDLKTSTATTQFASGGCVDGLGYDGMDDTLWMSDDASNIIRHYKPDGSLLSTNDVTGKLGSCGNSGLAIGGSYIFAANNGCQQIYALSKDLTKSQLFGAYPARIEDMECDDKTFAADGKAAIWSKDAYDNILNAWEANVGECGFGGYGTGPAGDPIGLLESLGARNPSWSATPQCNTTRPVNCATGNFWHEFVDTSIPGRGPAIAVTRTYNSLDAGRDGPFGFGWASSYAMSLTTDASGAVAVRQENGAITTFKPDGAGGFKAPPRVQATLTRNADGSFLFLRHKRDSFTFTAQGRLTAIKNLNGYTTSLAYDASNRLASVQAPGGRSVSFGYTAAGRVATATDSGGRTLSYTYGAAGDLASVKDVAGRTTAFTYDASHRMLTMTDPRGGVVTNVYDGSGRVVQQTDPLQLKTTFAYDSAGTTITDPNGSIERQEYRDGELVTLTRGVGTPTASVWRYSYDPFTLGMTSAIDPAGGTSSASYDRNGNLLSRTDALGRTSTYTYDDVGDLLTAQDASGATTTFTYDAAGNLRTRTRPTGTGQTQALALTYDPAMPGDVTSVTDPNSKAWQFGYDGTGNVTRVVEPTGSITTFSYDNLGRRTSQVSPKGNVAGASALKYTSTFSYNAFGDLTRAVNPLGNVETRTYDANRNLVSVTDPKGGITTFTYDADDRQTAATRANGSTLSSTLDGVGNVLRQIDGAGQATVYTYDAQNRVTSIKDPLGRATSLSHDSRGNRVGLVDAAGRAVTYRWDAASQLLGVDYADTATPDVTYGYDVVGRRTSMTDGTGTSTYTYDALGRLAQQVNGAGQTVGYGYDLAGHITRIVYPNGKAITRQYDASGRLASVTDWAGHTTAVSRDVDGNVSATTYPNAVTSTNTYDDADQVSAIAHKVGATTAAAFSYARDAAGQLLSETSSGVTTTYSYNQINQLTGTNATAYAYDSADNLVRTAAGSTLTYDSANQATSITGPSGGTAALTYDGVGDRTTTPSAAGRTLTLGYDQASRLTKVTAPGQGAVTGGSYHSLALKADGTVRAWGANYSGQLGDGSLTDATTPVVVSGVSNAVGLGAGEAHSVAVLADGTVRTWGYNKNGQLGTGSTSTTGKTPAQVPGLTNVVAVAAGGDHTAALKRDGTVWTWGYGKNGALGTGTTSNASTPVQVTGLTGVTAIAAGQDHVYALRTDGTVRSWGLNTDGQLGNGTKTTATKPVTVTGLTGVTAIASGAYHGLALKADGTVWTWGSNVDGQLGNGNVTSATAPVQAAGLAGVTAIVGGGYHSLAVRTDGTEWAWGLNNHGQLGGASTLNLVKTPARIPGISNAASVGAGFQHSLVALADGTVRADGYNNRGQLGIGGTADATTPTPVTGLTGVSSGAGSVQAEYSYDGDGYRSKKVSAGSARTFVWQLSASVPLLLSDGGTSYIYDDAGAPIMHIDAAGETLYYQHDQYNSTRLLTRADGTVAATFSYDPYGGLVAKTGTADTPLRWNGQYADAETGFYQLRARYYDPLTGGFLTRDPIAGVTRSPYAYVSGNPLNAADPLGLICLKPSCLVNDAKEISNKVQWAADGVAVVAAFTPAGPVVSPIALGVSAGAGIVNAGATCIQWLGYDGKGSDCAWGAGLTVGTAGLGNVFAPGRIQDGKRIYDTGERITQGTLGLFSDFVGWAAGYNPTTGNGVSSQPACSPDTFGPIMGPVRGPVMGPVVR